MTLTNNPNIPPVHEGSVIQLLQEVMNPKIGDFISGSFTKLQSTNVGFDARLSDPGSKSVADAQTDATTGALQVELTHAIPNQVYDVDLDVAANGNSR